MTEWGCLTLVGLGVVLAGFGLDWLAVSLRWTKIRPFTKVCALVLLIMWVLAQTDFRPAGLGWLLVLALVFGLLGDFLLLYPDRLFKWGLGAFLLGHITYLGLDYALVTRSVEAGLIEPIPGWHWAAMAVGLGLGLLLFYGVIIRQLKKPRPGWVLQVALYVYALCLTSVMIVGFLVAGLLAGGSLWIWALALGGTLFFASDFILAFNRFVRPVRLAHLWIMTTYHLAQFFLAIGFLAVIPMVS
jgi:uncharacterized membrane protein YhhN